jgi:hypothetical protein
MKRLLIAALALMSLTVQAKTKPEPKPSVPAKMGDPLAVWLKDAGFAQLYAQALGKSPVNNKNSWVYKDIGLGPSEAFAGQNANTWLRMATCASTLKPQCRANHIEIFYDIQNQEFYAYLTMGNRAGWVGAVRGPTSLEQKFFVPLLTAKDIR